MLKPHFIAVEVEIKPEMLCETFIFCIYDFSAENTHFVGPMNELMIAANKFVAKILRASLDRSKWHLSGSKAEINWQRICN